MAHLTPTTKEALRRNTYQRAGIILWAILLGLFASNLGSEIAKHYQFALNETESLPNWAFIIDKSQLSPKRYDYYAFIAPSNPYYPKGAVFTKQVVGIPGDLVSTQGRTFFINGRAVGLAKAFDRQGRPAIMAGSGVIPQGHYFMITPSRDSLDSRYSLIGLIETKRLIGRAHPVM